LFSQAPAQQAMWRRFWWGGIAAIFLLMLVERPSIGPPKCQANIGFIELAKRLSFLNNLSAFKM